MMLYLHHTYTQLFPTYDQLPASQNCILNPIQYSHEQTDPSQHVDEKMRREFDSIGCGLDSMLCSYVEGTLDTWAVRWCYHSMWQ